MHRFSLRALPALLLAEGWELRFGIGAYPGVFLVQKHKYDAPHALRGTVINGAWLFMTLVPLLQKANLRVGNRGLFLVASRGKYETQANESLIRLWHARTTVKWVNGFGTSAALSLVWEDRFRKTCFDPRRSSRAAARRWPSPSGRGAKWVPGPARELKISEAVGAFGFHPERIGDLRSKCSNHSLATHRTRAGGGVQCGQAAGGAGGRCKSTAH